MIKIIQGDITMLAVDAIVNVANQVMLGNAPKKLVSEGNFEQSENLSEAKALKRSRGGVDGAIHRAAAQIAVREVREFLSHAEAKCARAEGVGLPERSEPEGTQGAARGGDAEGVRAA